MPPVCSLNGRHPFFAFLCLFLGPGSLIRKLWKTALSDVTKPPKVNDDNHLSLPSQPDCLNPPLGRYNKVSPGNCDGEVLLQAENKGLNTLRFSLEVLLDNKLGSWVKI